MSKKNHETRVSKTVHQKLVAQAVAAAVKPYMDGIKKSQESIDHLKELHVSEMLMAFDGWYKKYKEEEKQLDRIRLVQRCKDAGIDFKGVTPRDGIEYKSHADGSISIFFSDKQTSAIRVPLAYLNARDIDSQLDKALEMLRMFEKARRLGITFVTRLEPF